MHTKIINLSTLKKGVVFFACVLTSFLSLASSEKNLKEQVKQTEIAFAKTMHDRDFKAFQSFLSKEAVFLNGKKVSRGIEEISNVWRSFYEKETAPFSWKPETVVVLDSGKLALSTGPVRNSIGELTAYYTSTWRLEDDGTWRIIFDKGNKACPK